VDSAPATVTINVVAENKSPVAIDDVLNINMRNGLVTLDVIENDIDPDGDFLSLLTVGTASFGNVVRATNRTIEYRYNACRNDSFTYVVTDAATGGKTDTGIVKVTCINHAPKISGIPQTIISVGEHYNFTPIATDEDCNTLIFSITNKPVWANFNNQTGQLSGIPSIANIGTHSNIVISVTDGIESDYLHPFEIVVIGPKILSLKVDLISAPLNKTNIIN